MEVFGWVGGCWCGGGWVCVWVGGGGFGWVGLVGGLRWVGGSRLGGWVEVRWVEVGGRVGMVGGWFLVGGFGGWVWWVGLVGG